MSTAGSVAQQYSFKPTKVPPKCTTCFLCLAVPPRSESLIQRADNLRYFPYWVSTVGLHPATRQSSEAAMRGIARNIAHFGSSFRALSVSCLVCYPAAAFPCGGHACKWKKRCKTSIRSALLPPLFPAFPASIRDDHAPATLISRASLRDRSHAQCLSLSFAGLMDLPSLMPPLPGPPPCMQAAAPPPWTSIAGSLLPSEVTLYEVGPRDGLQNEPAMIPTDVKVRDTGILGWWRQRRRQRRRRRRRLPPQEFEARKSRQFIPGCVPDALCMRGYHEVGGVEGLCRCHPSPPHTTPHNPPLRCDSLMPSQVPGCLRSRPPVLSARSG